MKLLFVLVLFGFMCLPACFKQEWHPYVVKVIDRHKVCTLSPKYLTHLTIMEVTANIDENDVHQFFLLEMIIWDPFHQFPQLFKNVLLLSCSEDTSHVTVTVSSGLCDGKRYIIQESFMESMVMCH